MDRFVSVKESNAMLPLTTPKRIYDIKRMRMNNNNACFKSIGANEFFFSREKLMKTTIISKQKQKQNSSE